VNTKLAAEL